MRKILGIDTGLHGGIAVIDQEMNILLLEDMPIMTLKRGKKNFNVYDVPAVCRLLWDLDREDTFAVIERTYPRPARIGGFPANNWMLGAGFMLFAGVLSYGKFRHHITLPKGWQKDMFVGMGQGETKSFSYMVASRLFPDAELSTPRGRLLDGRADALCIAEWGRRHLSGVSSEGEGA